MRGVWVVLDLFIHPKPKTLIVVALIFIGDDRVAFKKNCGILNAAKFKQRFASL